MSKPKFFAAGYIVEVAAVCKERHEFWRVCGGCLSKMVQAPDQLLIAVLFWCLMLIFLSSEVLDGLPLDLLTEPDPVHCLPGTIYGQRLRFEI